MNLHCSDVELLSKNFKKQTFFANKKCVEEYSLVKKNVRILRRTELACRLITPIRIGEVARQVKLNGVAKCRIK